MASLTCNNRKLKILAILLVPFFIISFILYRKSYGVYLLLNHGSSINSLKSSSTVAEITKIAAEEMADKWIVITTIHFPSNNIKQLTEINGWKVVVVGDLKTPNNWTIPGCVFLGIDQQMDMGYKSTEYLPKNSYTRKNIGYLYAIQHGARYIYDMDDNNHPTNGKINFDYDEITSGLIYDDFTNDVMNPYAHFGQPNIWPRGYPLDFIDKPNNNTYKLCKQKTSPIQQGLVNGDPDLDPALQLTRKLPNQQNFKITFDPRAPPVILPEGVFAPFNSKSTFFTYDALWALFLPTSVTSRMTDIWRGYWAQRLLWLLGHRLTFHPPNAIKFRNSSTFLKDFQEENQFHQDVNLLIQFLKNWTCNSKTFFQCVSKLSHDMSDEGFWDISDAELIDTWLLDLSKIGYKAPHMTPRTGIQECSEINLRVYFSPVMQSDTMQTLSVNDIYGFCQDYFNASNLEELSKVKGIKEKPKSLFEDQLLIIVFNFPFYANIHMLEALYQDHFPNMIYCGVTQSYDNFLLELRQGPFPWRTRDISFLNVTDMGGYYGYECAIRAIEMNYKVNGYMVLGDDVLFNFWNSGTINYQKAQLQMEAMASIKRDLEKLNWVWWESIYGKNPTNKALDELERIAKHYRPGAKRRNVEKYMQNRFEANLNMTIVHYASSDMYYIPKALSGMFVDVMKVFLKNRVFLEIAVPTVLVGLSPSAQKNGFWGRSLWGGVRDFPFNFYNSTSHYLHPVKFSMLFTNNVTRSDFCNTYIYDLFKTYLLS